MSDYFKRKVNGYLTVEASMIMPLVIFLMALLIYLTFFLYNRCVLSQDAYILAFRGSISDKEGESEILEYLEESAGIQFGNKYVGMKDLHKSITISNKSVTVRIQGKSGKGWNLEAIGEAHISDPEETIRRIRLIKKAGEKFKNRSED